MVSLIGPKVAHTIEEFSNILHLLDLWSTLVTQVFSDLILPTLHNLGLLTLNDAGNAHYQLSIILGNGD